MKPWKVILATLVIFIAGLVTGAVLVRVNQPTQPPPLHGPYYIQKWFLGRMEKELALTPQQVRNLDKAFAESRERIRVLWGMLEPEMQEELHEVQEKIQAELTPQQQKKLEELRLKSRPGRLGGGQPGEDRRQRGRSPGQGTGSGSRRDGSPAPPASGDAHGPQSNRPPVGNR